MVLEVRARNLARKRRRVRAAVPRKVVEVKRAVAKRVEINIIAAPKREVEAQREAEARKAVIRYFIYSLYFFTVARIFI